MGIVQELQKEKLRLEKQLRVISVAMRDLGIPPAEPKIRIAVRGKRKLSPEGRRKIAAAARKMWADRKKKQKQG